MAARLSGHVASPRASPRSSVDTHGTISSSRVRDDGRPHPENTWEILWNDVVLPLEMTLAAARQFVWRQAAELIMHYRRKQPTIAVHAPA